LTRGHGSCLIVTYFFITWESVTTLNKTELLDSVAREAGVGKSDAERVLNAFKQILRGAVRSGDKVSWPELGAFSVTQRKARTGRNPRTGAAVKIPASRAVKFSASSSWKEFLNKSGGTVAKRAAPARRGSSKKTAPSKATPTRKARR
jgi:DNA-binding protein HU-beta